MSSSNNANPTIAAAADTTKSPFVLPATPQGPPVNLNFDGFSAELSETHCRAMLEQLVRDAVSHSDRPPLRRSSTAQPSTMSEVHPTSVSLTEQHHDVSSSGNSRSDSLTHANWITATSTAGQQLWQYGASERSPGCTTIASIGYLETDVSPSWQSLSNQESQFTAPASPSRVAPESTAPKTGDGDSSGSHKNTPVRSETTTAGAVLTSNASSHYKTKRCRHFDQSGWCPYQHRCVFAHGDREFTLYTAQKGTGNGGKVDDSSPTASQLVREHIERNVRQLVEEYEQAVAEASAKATVKDSNAGDPPAPHGTRGAQISTTTEAPAVSIVRSLPHTQPPPPLSAAPPNHPPSNMHLLTTTPLAHPAMMSVNGASNPMAQLQVSHPQNPQQYHTHRQSFPMLNHHPLLIAPINGSPTGSTLSMMPPNPSSTAALQPFSTPPSYQQQQQQQRPMLFTMPSGAVGVLQMHPHQQQLPQQQIYLVETPYYNVMAANGGNAGMPVAHPGYTSVPAGPLNSMLTTRLV